MAGQVWRRDHGARRRRPPDPTELGGLALAGALPVVAPAHGARRRARRQGQVAMGARRGKRRRLDPCTLPSGGGYRRMGLGGPAVAYRRRHRAHRYAPVRCRAADGACTHPHHWPELAVSSATACAILPPQATPISAGGGGTALLRGSHHAVARWLHDSGEWGVGNHRRVRSIVQKAIEAEGLGSIVEATGTAGDILVSWAPASAAVAPVPRP